jgi:hypothetical protein
MTLTALARKHEQLVNDTLEWNASLPFVVSGPFLLSETSPSLICAEYKKQDLFELVTADGGLSSLLKWYFPPDQFHPDGDFPSSKDGWPKLKLALTEACIVLGYSLVANGNSNKHQPNTKYLYCARHRPSREISGHPHAPGDYRTDHIRSNR